MAIEAKKLKNILKNLPKAPGIYKMTNEEGRVIYVGKAKDLSKRVKQYFKKGYEHSTRTKKLIEKVDNVETITVDNELEAVILEHNLIKQLQPKYNVIMKDDKSYVYIKITREDFPRIQVVRHTDRKKDNAKYIGPKTAANKVRDTLKLLKKLFPFRHCNLDIQTKGDNKVIVTHKTIKYPCIDYHIKRCIGPCIDKCSPEEYQKIIQNVEDFLEGKAGNVLKSLQEQMQKYAKNHKFEQAAKLRDRIKKVESILERQNVSDDSANNQDIINYCTTHGNAYFNLFQVRNGKLIDQENFILKAEEVEEEENVEVLEAFLKQYYELATDIPKEILLPHKLEHQKEIKEFIESHSQIKNRLLVPQRGKKNKLLEMSLKNARIYADRNKPSWQEESELTENAIKELAKLIKSEKPIKRLECYDISHLSGTDTVGSMIVFQKGVPKKDQYRKFKLRTVQGKPDDFKSMEEVLYRRLNKISQNIQHQEYKFKKARKVDKKIIEKNAKIDLEKSDKQFYILEKEKEAQGFIAIEEHSPKISELTNLWIKKELRGEKIGYKLIREALKKAKSKRVYGIIKPELRDYYLLQGFEEIKKVPEELEEQLKKCKKRHKETPIAIAFDKYKHKEDKSFTSIPDLIVIDGGKGQLSSATKILKQLNMEIPYISLAKRLEEIFIPGEKTSIVLPKNNEALKLLQRARDEAHRFAISYNRNLRSKKFKKR
jgi:excinuclease ABC subunit C